MAGLAVTLGLFWHQLGQMANEKSFDHFSDEKTRNRNDDPVHATKLTQQHHQGERASLVCALLVRQANHDSVIPLNINGFVLVNREPGFWLIFLTEQADLVSVVRERVFLEADRDL